MKRVILFALAAGLMLTAAAPPARAEDAEVVAQLRASGFDEGMIKKILARGAPDRAARPKKERIYPDEKPVVPLEGLSEDYIPATLVAQADTTSDAGSGSKKKEGAAPAPAKPAGDTGKNAKSKDRVLTIEELYGKNLYQEDEGLVKPVVLREETKYWPGILAPNLHGSAGLFNTTSAYCLPKGKFAFGTHLVHNTITRYNDKDVNFLSGESARQFYIPATGTFGVMDALELAFVFPGQNWRINASELKPQNDSGSGMGDVKMRMKYKLPVSADAKSALAIGFGAKFPTADKETMYVMGATEEADYEMFGVLSQALTNANVHIDLGYVFTGDPRSARAGEKLYIDDKFRYNLGVDFSRTEDLTVSFELNGENWGAMGSKLEFTPGVRTKVNDEFVVDAALPITIFNDMEYGYDFKAILGASYVF